MENCKFRLSEPVEIILGFYRTQKGNILDTRKRWFSEREYELYISTPGSIDRVWIKESELKSCDPEVLKQEFHNKIVGIISS